MIIGTLKKYLFALTLIVSSSLSAAENIKIYSPYSPGHSATPALLRIIDAANNEQSQYKFQLEFKPGGNQIIAVKSLDESSLAIIAPAFIDNVDSGKLNEQDYRPVYALGDACWAVVTNKPLENQSEFVVGGVGFGNAAHLTALALGEKYNFRVKYIVFKSNNDALINMTGDNGVEFVIDKYEGYQSLQTKNAKLRMIAASCPQRLPQEPRIKTLSEMGIETPYIFNIAIAHKSMSVERQRDLATILHAATDRIGEKEIFKLSAMRPPQFDGVSTDIFYIRSIDQVRQLQKKYKEQIDAASK